VILVCAATRTEAACCRAGIADARAAGFEVLATGVGPERAASSLRRRLGRGAALVVSSGFGGALTDAIPPLSWITASALDRVVDGRLVPGALGRGALRAAAGIPTCRVVTADRVAAGDLGLFAEPAAVDMESAALAEVSAAAGIPFVVLRLITDSPSRPYPEFVKGLAAVLGAGALPERAVQGARALLGAARSPVDTLAFLRNTTAWRHHLRSGWREHAARGLPTEPME
jgi:adenosylhomocysteine nucleosidase